MRVLGNLGTRLCGVAAALALIGLIAPILARLDPEPARQVANVHTAFNVVLALAFLPFVDNTARLLRRLVPERRLPPISTSQEPSG